MAALGGMRHHVDMVRVEITHIETGRIGDDLELTAECLPHRLQGGKVTGGILGQDDLIRADIFPVFGALDIGHARPTGYHHLKLREMAFEPYQHDRQGDGYLVSPCRGDPFDMVKQGTVALPGHFQVILAGAVEEIVKVKALFSRLGYECLRLLTIAFRREEGSAPPAKGIVGDLAEERIYGRGFFAQAIQKCFIPIACH